MEDILTIQKNRKTRGKFALSSNTAGATSSSSLGTNFSNNCIQQATLFTQVIRSHHYD